MTNKASNFLIKLLTTQIAPMVYTTMAVSVLVGFFFSTGVLVQNGESRLFEEGAIINAGIWGLLLFVFACMAMWGLSVKNHRAIKTGAFVCFCLWVMASIQMFYDNHYYGFIIFGLFHVLFQAYVYLSSSLGVLERSPVVSRNS